jgi:hypothetical protein
VIPNLRVVLTAPQWLVVTMLAFVIAAALFRIGLDLYVTHIRIEDIDQTRDDADKGARGVERHEEELEAMEATSWKRRPCGRTTSHHPHTWRRTTDEMPAVTGGGLRLAVIAIACALGCAATIVGTAWGMWPYNAEYHQ